MTNTKRNIYLLTALLFSTALAQASDHEHEHHEAHVHGEAQLFVALESNTIDIEFKSPAMNILGFEHKPSNQAQHKALDTAVHTLKQPNLLFRFPTSAQCETMVNQVESPFSEQEDHTYEEGSHSNFTGHYQFQCADLSSVERIEINIFKQFPGTEVIEVQSISKRGQQTIDLTPKQNSFQP